MTKTFSEANPGSTGRELASATSLHGWSIADSPPHTSPISSLSDVYDALSYYYDHIEEIRAFQRENDEAFDRIASESLHPKETIQ